MAFKSFSLKNIKSFRKEAELKLAPITIIIGKNSSGKSTLVKTLLMLQKTLSTKNVTRFLNIEGYSSSKSLFNENSFSSLKFGTKKFTTKLNIKYKAQMTEETRRRALEETNTKARLQDLTNQLNKLIEESKQNHTKMSDEFKKSKVSDNILKTVNENAKLLEGFKEYKDNLSKIGNPIIIEDVKINQVREYDNIVISDYNKDFLSLRIEPLITYEDRESKNFAEIMVKNLRKKPGIDLPIDYKLRKKQVYQPRETNADIPDQFDTYIIFCDKVDPESKVFENIFEMKELTRQFIDFSYEGKKPAVYFEGPYPDSKHDEDQLDTFWKLFYEKNKKIFIEEYIKILKKGCVEYFNNFLEPRYIIDPLPLKYLSLLFSAIYDQLNPHPDWGTSPESDIGISIKPHYINEIEKYKNLFKEKYIDPYQLLRTCGLNSVKQIIQRFNKVNEVMRDFSRGFISEKDKTEWISKSLKSIQLPFSFYVNVNKVGEKTISLENEKLKSDNSKFVQLEESGSGLQTLMPLFSSLYDARGLKYRNFYIEEPENRLHPSIQGNLIEFLSNYGRINRHHFTIETHSEHFILRLQKLIRKGIMKPNEVAVNYVYIDEDNSSSVDHMSLDENGDFINSWRDGFFDDRLKELDD